MTDLPAKSTIERKSKPLDPQRHLAVLNSGHVGWVDPVHCPVATFDTERQAETFRHHRMNGHAADAVVVRHTIH